MTNSQKFFKRIFDLLKNDGAWIYPDSGSMWSKTTDNTIKRQIGGDDKLDQLVKTDLEYIGYKVDFDNTFTYKQIMDLITGE